MRRRDVLAPLVAAAAGLAGCVEGRGVGNPGPTTAGAGDPGTRTGRTTTGTTTLPTSGAPAETTVAGTPPGTAAAETPTRTPPATTECSTPAVPAGKVRCRGSPTSIRRSYADRKGWGDDIDYHPENATVRVAIAKSGDEPTIVQDWSLEKWGTIRSNFVARDAAVDAAADRLGWREFGGRPITPPGEGPKESSRLVPLLTITTVVEDCEVVHRPPVSLSEFVDVAPRAVDVTVSLEGDEFSRTVPVYAHHALREVRDGGNLRVP